MWSQLHIGAVAIIFCRRLIRSPALLYFGRSRVGVQTRIGISDAIGQVLSAGGQLRIGAKAISLLPAMTNLRDEWLRCFLRFDPARAYYRLRGNAKATV